MGDRLLLLLLLLSWWWWWWLLLLLLPIPIFLPLQRGSSANPLWQRGGRRLVGAHPALDFRRTMETLQNRTLEPFYSSLRGLETLAHDLPFRAD